MSVVGDAMQAIKLVADLLKELPVDVGTSLLFYEDDKLSHLRIINHGAATIHGFKCEYKTDGGGQIIPIRRVYRMMDDVFGNRVRAEITIGEAGIYLAPAKAVFVPLSDLSDINKNTDVQFLSSYKSHNGATAKVDFAHVVKVMVTAT